MLKKIFFMGIFLFNLLFLFSTDEIFSLEFYKSFKEQDLIFLLQILEKEKDLSSSQTVLLLIDKVKRALSSYEVDFHPSQDRSNYISYRNSYNKHNLILKAIKTLKRYVFIDNLSFLRTLDGRRVIYCENTFTIRDNFSSKDYSLKDYDFSQDELFSFSIEKPNYSAFNWENDKVLVKVEDLDLKVYYQDIESLEGIDLVFLFYNLFPLSKLQTIDEWYPSYDFTIKDEIKKLFNREIDMRVANFL